MFQPVSMLFFKTLLWPFKFLIYTAMRHELGYRKRVEELQFYEFVCTFSSVALEQNISHFVGNVSGYKSAKFQICLSLSEVKSGVEEPTVAEPTVAACVKA